MKEHPGRRIVEWIVLSAVIAPLFLHATAFASNDEGYVLEDARITGREIHAFSDSGERVSVVLGDFSLEIGRRTLTGRDAVVWITDHQAGSATRHDITIYAEGSVRLVEGDEPALEKPVMLLTFHQQGRVRAKGQLSSRPLKDFPLYLRAVEAREKGHISILAGSPPSQVVVSTSNEKAPTPASNGEVAIPAFHNEQQVPGPTAEGDASPKEARLEADGRKPTRPQPVNYRADRFSLEVLDDGRRVTIARGNVYISRGSPDSAEFMEMRAQTAVIFTQPGVTAPVKDTRVPWSPRIDQTVEMPRAGQFQEAPLGVYLEGDVIIALGERYFRAESAYYDFATDRSIVLDPVFRTIQKGRNIPIYIRATEARTLSAREVLFRDAKVSTSDFYSPTYHIGTTSAYMMDTTPYDQETGERLSEQSWLAQMKHTTFNVRGVPVAYFPYIQGDFTEGNSPLRKAQFGRHGRFGFGVETEWHLFRLLGLLKPEGVRGILELNWYDRGALAGADIEYTRRDRRGNDYSGYWLAYGLYDRRQRDSFGRDREDIPAPLERGRLLMRHKHFLPRDWQLQFELSYICDRNFMEQFFRDEFWAGKEQETLIYARKQRDNWAFTSLLQYRLNRFQSQSESAPDLGAYLLGQPVWGDRLTYFGEAHLGLKRFRAASSGIYPSPFNEIATQFDDHDSRFFLRADTRNEIDVPMHFGPFNVVPYVVGRASYWDDEHPWGGEKCRPYGQVGLRANTHLWRVYNSAQSRLWDINRLKHVITPELVGWLGDTHHVVPDELYPLDSDIEQHLLRTSGVAINVHQRLQTKRGPKGREKAVDWMRLGLSLGLYGSGAYEQTGQMFRGVALDRRQTSDGRFFFSRPEYSMGRNHFNADYTWNISDATALLADFNYDIDQTKFARGNIGLAVQRDPRLRYYAGVRYIDDVDSAVGTFGFNYKLNRKYSFSAFQQYDFSYDGGGNLATSLTITRKFPRWYGAFTFVCDRSGDELGLYVSFWPEGIPEVRLGGGRMSLLPKSSRN